MPGLLGSWISRWFDSRLRLAKFTRRILNHVFPDHWSFMLGEVALYSFVVLVVTGVFLSLFYNASSAKAVYHGSYHALDGIEMSAAYRSVIHLSFDVRAGLLVRQMHHWAALIFIGAIVCHLARIFFTGAYRRPRELNWMVGVTLFALAIVNGYLGYSLLGDLLSGAGLRIAYAIVMSIPIFGQWLAFICFGGVIPSDAMFPHMYGMHIFVIPTLIGILIAVHLAMIWRQLHTNYPRPRRTDHTIVGSRLWPSYTFKSLGLFFLVFALITMLGGLVQIDPIWVYGRYDPIAIVPGAQPDWYLGWIEGAMRLFPEVHLRPPGHYLVPEVFFPAVLMPALVFLALYLYPFFDKLLSSDIEGHHNVLRLPYQQPFNTAVGCAGFMFMLVLLFAGGDDVVAVATGTSLVTIREYLRVLVFVAPVFTWFVTYWLCVRKRRRVPIPEMAPVPEGEPVGKQLARQ